MGKSITNFGVLNRILLMRKVIVVLMSIHFNNLGVC